MPNFASNASAASYLFLNLTSERIEPLWLNSCLLYELKEIVYLLKDTFVLINTFME